MAPITLSRDNYFRYADALICLPFLLAPFFLNLPYRVNLFLSWEGAYRLAIGQVPYRDFGLPMGIGYWLVPALFFKVFGATFASLIKAQFLINLTSILAVRGILYNLKVRPMVVTLTILVFCLTYVIYNFWPWYNHSVVVYELVAVYFLTLAMTELKPLLKYSLVSLSAFFSVFSFLTKQDVGGICFVLCSFLVAYEAIRTRNLKLFLVYPLTVIAVLVAAVAPFIKYDFLYWFNYGQPPHDSRISLFMLVDSLLDESHMAKLYLAGMTVLVFVRYSFRQLIEDRDIFVLVTISVCMIGQAIVTRVTSPLPTDHMSYYHTFGFVALACFIPRQEFMGSAKAVILATLCVLVLYSGGYWKYASKLLGHQEVAGIAGTEHHEKWILSDFETIKGVYLPESTIQGIRNIAQMPIVTKPDLKVLNMSELTFLAKELGYTPLTNHPLWYHVNIGMFQKQIDEINQKIEEGYYDVVLFEDIPSLTEFYPASVYAQLNRFYTPSGKFLAPRQLEDSHIEVFVKKATNNIYASGKPNNDKAARTAQDRK